MKKISTLLITFVLISSSLFAQKPALTNLADSLKYGYWTRNTNLGVNLSGSAFSGNWQGGGINNLILGGVFANRSDLTKGKGVWSNDLQMQLGTLTNYAKGKDKENRKNLDRIFFETKYSQKIKEKLNWFAAVSFLSQMTKGVDYSSSLSTKPTISSLFAPAFLTEGIGLEYVHSKFLRFSFGGATLRQTIVASDNVKKSLVFANDAAIYGVPKNKTVRNQGGFQAVAAYDKNITPNVNLKWRWQTFTPYKFNEFDHNINMLATIKVNKYVNLNASLIGIYDWNQTGGKFSADKKPLNLKPWQLNGGANLGFALKL
jgi:Protein of unknown function (DUF3078)